MDAQLQSSLIVTGIVFLWIGAAAIIGYQKGKEAVIEAAKFGTTIRVLGNTWIVKAHIKDE